VDLERLMLEGISFEFDTRHPQQLVAKILQVEFNYDFSNPAHRPIFLSAWAISMDLNYTFALLKQTTGTLAIACIELTLRLLGHLKALDKIFPEALENPYERFSSTRVQVSETIMDLLDLYTTNRSLTFAGTQFSREDIVDVRISLNKISEQYNLSRYAHWRDEGSGLFGTPAYVTSLKAPRNVPTTSTSPKTESKDDGNTEEAKSNGETSSKANSLPVRRFILQPGEAVREVADLDDYFVTAEEEYDKEHEIDDGWATASDDDGDVYMKNVQRTPPTGPGKNRRR
jgi:CTD kinase subunit beta